MRLSLNDSDNLKTNGDNMEKPKRKTYDGIIIDREHRNKIVDSIRKIDEHYQARTLINDGTGGYSSVLNCIDQIEKHFESYSKESLESCTFRYDKNHQNFPESYLEKTEGKIPGSTQIVVTYLGGKWRLLNVVRQPCMPADYSVIMQYRSHDMVSEILEKASKF